MKKLITIIIFILFLLILPFICADKKVNFIDLEKEIEPFINNNFQKNSNKYIYKNYNLNSDYYKNFISYNSKSYMEVEEITIFYEPDKNKQDIIEQKIKNHIEKKISTFKGYGEEQVKMLNNAYITIKGEYVFCIVLKNNQEIKEKINKLF